MDLGVGLPNCQYLGCSKKRNTSFRERQFTLNRAGVPVTFNRDTNFIRILHVAANESKVMRIDRQRSNLINQLSNRAAVQI